MLIFIVCTICIILVSLCLVRSKYKKKFSRFAQEISSHNIFRDFFEGKHQNLIIRADEAQKFLENAAKKNENISQEYKKHSWLALKNAEIDNFIASLHQFEKKVEQHNEKIEQQTLIDNKNYFDTVLKYPLDQQQRESIVSESDNCLVISGAGSGKTSSIIGKVRYLLDIKKVEPSKILLISYTNKAAAELTERLNTPELRGYTFHKLAIDIIGKSTGEKPSICENSDKIFVQVFHDLINDLRFQKHVVDYFAYQQVEESEFEKNIHDFVQQKKKELKALLPDMDGHDVYVRSKQEKQICFALSTLGVKFRYEEQYEHNVADENHSQYCPDFSIYFEKDGVTKRIYLEHFGINQRGNVPTWFANERGITWEEANKQYGDGITWKRSLHEKNGTTLIETTSAELQNGNVEEILKNELLKVGVPIQPIPPHEIYKLIVPDGSRQEKFFIRLIATFANIMKTNLKSIEDIRKNADERGRKLIDNIFRPAIEGYNKRLKELNQKDFTDLIIEATTIAKQTPTPYEYIVVDEFQDISFDRYQFLIALREGNPKARLYCVGDDWQSIYRFSGSDMSLFSQFQDYFGKTTIKRIETTYRYGQPLIDISGNFVQKNPIQIRKKIRPFNSEKQTNLYFCKYEKQQYIQTLESIVKAIPSDKKIYLLGRYSFDDYWLSKFYMHKTVGSKLTYTINNRDIEFLTVHKSKGLEADVVILLQCNAGQMGFPSNITNDPVLENMLSKGDNFAFGEERRLFYVAITRAKDATYVLYNDQYPSPFVKELLFREEPKVQEKSQPKNANKHWGPKGDAYLTRLYCEGKSIKEISRLMGRSYTSILLRLEKIGLVDPEKPLQR